MIESCESCGTHLLPNERGGTWPELCADCELERERTMNDFGRFLDEQEPPPS